MECIVPGGLLMEFKRILTYIINQSEMSQKLSSYGPCTIDARTLLSHLNAAAGQTSDSEIGQADGCENSKWSKS
jgi:hypothetical protein